MATKFFIKVKFAIHKQPDGTLVATAHRLPIVAVAKSEAELEDRIRAALSPFDRYVSNLDEVEAREFFAEQKVRYQEFKGTVTNDHEEREVTLPVLVGAP